jgi:hypothetical protein
MKYRYYKSKRIFILKETDGFIYRFECGHWCTDNVFIDLYNIKLKKYNYELINPNQLKLL